MAFKWIQCEYCGHTKHIDNYPAEERRSLGRMGIGICRRCTFNPAVEVSLLATHGMAFIEYLTEQRQ